MTVEVIENLFTVVVDETTENVTVTYIGAQGPVGPGVAGGGTAGQYLRKTSSVDYASEWDTIDISTSDVTGTLPIAKGGTNATTASGARANLSAAILGANNDITSMTGVTGGISTPDYVDFDTAANPALVAGRLAWNSDDGTLDVGLANNVVLQTGQELLYYAKNTSGGSIPMGAAVMFTGALGASGKLTFAKAVSNGSISAEYMMGIATQTVADNGFGYVTDFGLVRGFNTTGSTKTVPESWQDGDLLYLDPVYPGELTKVQPSAPNLHSPIAVVVNASSGGSGSIFVRMKTGENLNELHDVKINGSLAANSFLVYDSTDSRWENRTATESRTALGLGTIATQNSDNVSVTGGSINNTAIGGTTPAAGTFTTLTATGQTSLGGAAGAEGLRVTTTASGVNWVQVAGCTNTGFSNLIGAEGSSTNIQMLYYSKGAFGHVYRTNGPAGPTQFVLGHTASAVNYVEVTGAATGGQPTISPQGSDTNIPLSLIGKGNGAINLQSFVNLARASANYLQAGGADTGSFPSISALGSDTNIDLALTPKGTGLIRFGTYVSNAATTFSLDGYIELKDAAGNIRKLAVIA